MRIGAVAAIGVVFSKDWKPRPARRGARNVVLNARDNAAELYANHGYVAVGEAETLFGVIRYA
jgi:hypothetical protein